MRRAPPQTQSHGVDGGYTAAFAVAGGSPSEAVAVVEVVRASRRRGRRRGPRYCGRGCGPPAWSRPYLAGAGGGRRADLVGLRPSLPGEAAACSGGGRPGRLYRGVGRPDLGGGRLCRDGERSGPAGFAATAADFAGAAARSAGATGRPTADFSGGPTAGARPRRSPAAVDANLINSISTGQPTVILDLELKMSKAQMFTPKKRFTVVPGHCGGNTPRVCILSGLAGDFVRCIGKLACPTLPTWV